MKTILLMLLFLPMIQCCGQQKDTTHMNRKPIEQVINENQDKLLSLDGVQGFYQGLNEDGADCIVLMIDTLTKKLTEQIPDSLEGYPVRIEAGGKIIPLK